MSKFIDAIKAEMTGRKFADMLIPPLLSVTEDLQRVDDYSTAVEYRIHVTYGCNVQCQPKDLEDAKANIIRSLREEIFGDARKKAHALHRAVYSGSRDQVFEKLDDLMKEILG